MKRVIVGIVLCSLVIAFLIYAMIPSQSGSPDNGTTADATPSVLGRVFVFLILFGGLGAVLYAAYRDKRGTNPRPAWKEILAQPVFVVILGLVAVNAMASLFIYKYWLWFWSYHSLFWGANIGLVILVHFFAKKEMYAKCVAATIGTLILLGLIITAHGDSGHWNTGLSKEEYKAQKDAQKLLRKNPVLAAVAKCRPAAEFDSVDEVTAATARYEKEGLLPWQENMSCWQTLIPREVLPIKLAIVEAPTDKPSKEIRNPKMRATTDWPDPPEGCEIIPDGDESKKLPCDKAAFSEPLKFFQFHSATGKPLLIKVVVRR